MNNASDKRRPVLLAAVTLVLAVAAYPAAAQVITEFRTPTPGSQPLEIASGPGGVWFTEHGTDRIGLITPDGHFSEFTVSASPLGIVAGPDGNLWFTSDGHISRMTTDGTVSNFVTLCCSFPGWPPSITVGPDSLLWFTDGDIDGGKIGNSNVAGQISENFIPSLDFLGLDPATITSGPDGNLWFTEFGPADDAKIGRLAPSGSFSEFALPGVKGVVWGIAAGSDGNLWFTETTSNKVGRITTSGQVTEFNVSGNPRGITAGPDGNLWFVENTGNKIGRITTRGDIVEFPIPTPNAQPWGIGAGPDGNIWFTESGTGQIGRVALLKTCDACHDLSVVDLTLGSDDRARLLRFDVATGQVALDSVDEAGLSFRSGPFGPYQGWTPRRTASGPDGLTRVLWTNDDGSAGLWLVNPQGVNQASYRLSAMSGFTAADVAASAPGQTHVLWTASDGRVAITSVDNTGATSAGPTYGPYAGWTAIAAADGPDGLTRVLWNNLDGRAAISFARAGNLLASYSYGPAAGWAALDVAVGGDGLTRILWSHLDGRIALWIVDAAGNVATYGPTYSAPAFMSASRIAAGPDGSARVLFTDDLGSAAVWLLSPAGVLEGSVDLEGPGASQGVLAGIWTGTFSSDNVELCVFSGIPAQATFRQIGSIVEGILSAPTAPCLALESRVFSGTIVGNTLTGSDGGFGLVQGTISGTTLEIGLGINAYGYAGEGKLHLHR